MASLRLTMAVMELVDAIVEEVSGAGPVEPSAPVERLLSVAEVADMLSIGRTMVYERIADGDLRSIKVGRRRLVPQSALTEFMHGR